MRNGKSWCWKLMVVLTLIVMTGHVFANKIKELKKQEKEIKKELKKQEATANKVRKQLIKVRNQIKDEKKKGSVAIDSTQFYIPRMKTPPVIDGIVNEKEWDGAIGIPLTTGIYGMFIRSSSYFYIGWDPEYLYFGQRLPMREGEQPLRLNREPRHDNVYCGETSLEVYVDRKSHGSHPSGCRWQFMGNAVGNRWDREDQYEIGQNFYGWNGEWKYKQRLTPDGKFWEAEIAIPRKTVYQKQPIKPGDLWWIGLATNLHRPWCFSGFYGWRVPATFSDDMPQIRLYHPERSIKAKGIVYDMNILNTTKNDFKGELITRLFSPRQKDPKKRIVFEKVRPINLAPGKDQNFNVKDIIGDKAADKQTYKMAIIVKQGNKSIYTWSYPIRYNHPDNIAGLDYTPAKFAFPLKAKYNPLSNYVRVEVDKYDYSRKDEVEKVRFVIKPKGGEEIMGKGFLEEFNYGKGETKVSTPEDLAPGKYICFAELLDKNGNVLASEKAEFVRKDHAKEFPWLNNTIGESDILLKPFKPMQVDGNVINAFEKQITLDGTALPEKVVSADVNLLHGPIAFTGSADGKAFTVKPDDSKFSRFFGLLSGKGPELLDDSETHADYRGAGTGGPIDITTDVHWEYDSTARIKVKISPKEKTAKLDNLKLVIPFTKEGGINFIANALNMRLSNVAGTIPDKGKVGTVWDSTKVPYQKMTVGSFVPFMWIGNLSSGITWFADSDEGWWPTNKHPAIEIVRTKDNRVNLVFNIASEPVEFSEPREIEFGLNVNPVRPHSDHRGSRMTFGYLVETGRWDPKQSKGKVFARRYPEDLELNKKYIDATHKYNEIFAPYTEMSYADFMPKARDYFEEEWNIGGMKHSPFFTKSSNDHLLYWTKRWIDDAGLDGYYFDNIFHRLNWNLNCGTAYKLPDGRIQPGYNTWGMRDQIKRIRTVLQETHPDTPTRICIHNTRFQFAPIMAFADLAMGGEMATPSANNPNAGDFMDMYPRDFMDVMYNVPLWGYRLSHLYHFRNRTYTDEMGEYDREKAKKVHRSAMATMLVHGVEFFQGIDYKNFLTSKFRLLKKLPGGPLKFIPSWKANGLFRIEGNAKDLDVAIYKKKDVLLIIVANYSKHVKRARIWVDFPKLIDMPGKMETRGVYDFETLEFPGYLTEKNAPEKFPRIGSFQAGHNIMHQSNTLRIKVEPHDFRAILFINQPLGGRGAGF